MGQPITWQNVHGASLADASRPLEIASRSMNGAFDGIRDVLKDQQANQQANWNNTKTNNTNDALNAITQYNSPEEFAAAQRAGAIQSLLSSKGAQIDQQAVRAAADGRLGVLQQRAEQGFRYDNAAADQRDMAVRDQVASLTAQGKLPEAQALLAQHEEMRNKAALFGAIDARGQVDVQRGRETTEFGWKGDKRAEEHKAAEKNLQVADANIRQSNASAAASTGSLAIAQENQKYTREDRISSKIADNITRLGDLGSASPSSTKGAQAIEDAISKMKDPVAQQNARKLAAEFSAVEGATVASIIGATTSTDSYWWKPDAISRAAVRDRFKTLIDSVGTTAEKERTSTQRDRLLAEGVRLEQQRKALDASQGGIVVTPSGKKVVVPPTGGRGVSDADASAMIADSAARAAQQYPVSGAPGSYGPNGWVANAPPVVPVSGATVVPKNADEALVRANEEKFKRSVADQFVTPKAPALTAAQLLEQKKQQQRELEAVLARGRQSGGTK